MNQYIKKVHAKNLELIAEHNIVKDTKLINKNNGSQEIVDYTHELYGWVKTTAGDKQKVPQQVEEILKSWEVHNNPLTDEECAEILEFSKNPNLNLKDCNHGYKYYGLGKNSVYKSEISRIEEILIKWCPNLMSFSNFTGEDPNRIRIQCRYSDTSSFVGVHYLSLPSNNWGG